MKTENIRQFEAAEKNMIGQLITLERIKSQSEHEGKFSSMHEAESVIFEELEEAEETFDARIKCYFDKLHTAVRQNKVEDFKASADVLLKKTVECILELIQLGAMCEKTMSLGKKALYTYKKGGKI